MRDVFFAVIILFSLVLSGCKMADTKKNYENKVSKGDEMNTENALITKDILKVNTDIVYQTMESFGTSGAWWSQYVGGFDNAYKDTGRSVREEIAMLLFDKEYGIGLTSYRYNIGAGSAESGNGIYWDVHRRAKSFETAPFTYDWDRDKNAVWFLKKAVELGAQEVIFFCNSPLERLTINGMAQVSKGEKKNILPENYDDFAKYVLDVTEHFVEEGIPVKYVSPINEPQWDWFEGQEGCHYEPEQIPGVYQIFLKELKTRDSLQAVELSGPESGEWKGDAIKYTSALLNNTELSGHFKTIDNHSYWSDTASKQAFKRWMDANHPEVKIRMSEWCEMINGSDVTMDSAFNLVKVIAEDLTLLDVVSWQNWVAVAPGGYRDGLIYVNEKKKTLNPLKRLWGYGNYSRYIRPGYKRVDLEMESKELTGLNPVAFTGVNELGQSELVLVFINQSDVIKQFHLAISNDLTYNKIDIYETSKDKNLERVVSTEYAKNYLIQLEQQSIMTVVISTESK